MAELISASDSHLGTADDVMTSLNADRTLEHVTDLVFQVHSIDPPHVKALRSIEVIAGQAAPALGCRRR